MMKAKPKKTIGRPFQKGQSGNPSGRPKKTQEELALEKACREKTVEALDSITEIMRNGGVERNRLAAAQYIIDRGWGKAKQSIEVDATTRTLDQAILELEQTTAIDVVAPSVTH